MDIRITSPVGNWNDRCNGGDTRTTHKRPRTWKAIDSIVRFFNLRGF